MRVDHLYVIAIYASQDESLVKSEETRKTAQALFTRHGAKSKTAVNINVRRLYGESCECEIVSIIGGEAPLGPLLTTSATPLPSESSADTGGSAGIYVVFHNDNGGLVIMPKDIAWLLKMVVPTRLHPGLARISLFACDVAGHEDGDPIGKTYGLNVADVGSFRGPTFIGGIAIMSTLLKSFHDVGLRPMVCGYDIPVFAGDGPLKEVSKGTVAPSRKLKLYEDGKWHESAYDTEDVYGRKLILHPTRKNALTTLKSAQERSIASEKGNYRAMHKKVLQVNEAGVLCDALAGWSTKTS